MTHTPASGPRGPRTTPPMSSLSIATAACRASAGAEKASPAGAAKPITARVQYKACLRFMFALLLEIPGLLPGVVRKSTPIAATANAARRASFNALGQRIGQLGSETYFPAQPAFPP